MLGNPRTYHRLPRPSRDSLSSLALLEVHRRERPREKVDTA